MPPGAVYNTRASLKRSGDKVKAYSWEEIKKHKTVDDCWLVVSGKVYDVTKWVPKHPGGEYIVQGAGRESSPLFYSYHPPHVTAMLAKYEIGVVENYDSYYNFDTEFYALLKRRVEAYMKQNKMDGTSFLLYLKTIFILSLWAFAYYHCFIKGELWGAVLWGIAHAQFGIGIGHDGVHHGFSKSHWLSVAAGFFMDLLGGSSFVWTHQHNIGHHANTNKHAYDDKEIYHTFEFDPDAKSGVPILRVSPNVEWRWWHRFQHIYYWSLLALVGPKWYINDVRALLRRKYLTIEFYKLPASELPKVIFTKLFFVLYAVVIPSFFMPFSRVVFLLVVATTVFSWNFVLMFSVNHLTHETTFPSPETTERDWAKLQIMTSTNFCTDGKSLWSKFWALFSGGLNYQVEHHLFPGLPHTYLPKISPIVQRTCQEHGVRYRSFPTYWQAIYAHYTHLKEMGRPPAAAKKA